MKMSFSVHFPMTGPPRLVFAIPIFSLIPLRAPLVRTRTTAGLIQLKTGQFIGKLAGQLRCN